MSARLIFSHPGHPPASPSVPFSLPSSASRRAAYRSFSLLGCSCSECWPVPSLRFRCRHLSHSLSLSLSLPRSPHEEVLLHRGDFSFLRPIRRFRLSPVRSLFSGLVVSHLRRRGVRHVRITPSTTTRSLIIRTPVCRDAVFPGSVEFSVSEPMAGFCLLATVHRFQPRISVQSYFALTRPLFLFSDD